MNAQTESKAINVTTDRFDAEVLSSDLPVLVDFWAPWCPPCRILGPTVDEIAGTLAGRVRVAKVDVDGSPELGERFGVRSIPTLALFRGGEVVWRHVGLIGSGELLEAIEAHAGA